MNTFMGLGSVTMLAPVTTTTLKPVGTTTTPTATVAKPSVWDKLNNVITKVVQPATNVYTQIKTNQQSSTPGIINSSFVPNSDQSSLPPAAEQKDNTMKYVLIGGAVILVGTGIYFATKKKKK